MLSIIKKTTKFSLPKKVLISLIFSFHSLGIVSSLLRPKRGVELSLPRHLLRFFSWWSVHASILTILAIILIRREDKKTSSYFSQLLIFIATIYNLVIFVFISSYFLAGKIISCGVWLDLQLFTWHFIAPLLTIFYFYFYARIDKLKAKLIRTLLFALISPIFYFFYIFTLAKINNKPTGSLSPYMKKYPYYIFEWIVDRKWNILIINFLIASFVFISLCLLIIWTKIACNKKLNKKFSS